MSSGTIYAFKPVELYFAPEFGGEPFHMITGCGSRHWFAKEGRTVRSAKVPAGNQLICWIDEGGHEKQNILAAGEYPTLPPLNYSEDGCLETYLDGDAATTIAFQFDSASDNPKYVFTVKLHEIGEVSSADWRTPIQLLFRSEPITCAIYVREVATGEYVAQGSVELDCSKAEAEFANLTTTKESKFALVLSKRFDPYEVFGGTCTNFYLKLGRR